MQTIDRYDLILGMMDRGATITELMDRTGCSRRTILRYIRQIEEKHHIERPTTNPSGGGIYRLA